MNSKKWKKITSFLLIIIGAILLIIEIGSSIKNYYIQSIGVICLMSGIFLVNANVSSTSIGTEVETEINNEEE